MTDRVRTFGNTAGSNNVPGGLFAEGVVARLTTDNFRQLQAALRQYANEAEWFAIGDRSGPATFTFLSATSFRVQGASLTSVYHTGRRVRATGNSTGVITGTITSRSTNGGNTDVVVKWDGSGSLSSESLLIELAINSAINSSVPGSIDHDLAVIGLLAVTGQLSVTGDLTANGDAAVTGDLAVNGQGTFGNVVTTTGPFTLLSVVAAGAGESISVPSNAKRALMKVYGAGGGGGSAPDSFFGSVNRGLTGEGFSVTSTPGNIGITITGAGGGGDPDSPQDQSGRSAITQASIAASVSGSAILSSGTLIGQGGQGGQGAAFGSGGNNGHFVQALIDCTNLTSFQSSGGVGGGGGQNSGGPDGGRGVKAQYLVEFYG